MFVEIAALMTESTHNTTRAFLPYYRDAAGRVERVTFATSNGA